MLYQWIGLIGLLGLLGLFALKYKIPKDSPGAAIRLCGIFGLIGIGGFWIPPLGACGAFGALGLWGHPITKYRNLAWFGWLGILGLLVYFVH